MKALLFVGALLGGWLAVAPPADAGGWAISSLDWLPRARQGDRAELGFTILQHGVTPVDVNEGVVAVVLRSADGMDTAFPATQQGKTGHYVAEVEFPEAGDYTWRIEQGWFGAQELGALEIAPTRSSGAEPASDIPRRTIAPLAVRLLLPLAALTGVSMVLADVRRKRRPIAVAT